MVLEGLAGGESAEVGPGFLDRPHDRLTPITTKIGTQIPQRTQISQIFISVNLSFPRHPRSIFRTEGERERASDGSDFVMRFRLADIDPLEQILTLQYWAQRWQGEELLGEEKRTLTSNIYFKNELVLMLRQAGFDEVTVQGDFTDADATPEHDDLVFIARKSL